MAPPATPFRVPGEGGSTLKSQMFEALFGAIFAISEPSRRDSCIRWVHPTTQSGLDLSWDHLGPIFLICCPEVRRVFAIRKNSIVFIFKAALGALSERNFLSFISSAKTGIFKFEHVCQSTATIKIAQLNYKHNLRIPTN